MSYPIFNGCGHIQQSGWYKLSKKCESCNSKYCEKCKITCITKCYDCSIEYCNKCAAMHLHSCINRKAIKKEYEKGLESKMDNLEKKMGEMHEMLTALMYAPNGPMYKEAKDDFDTLKN